MKRASLRVARASFTGRILNRGFWLYVWRIAAPRETVLYVGRTGDSSSANAASPFSRLSAHLQSKETAKGNAMHRHLVAAGIDPAGAQFQMVAMGPLFAEQSTFEDHKPFRDRMAAMEKQLAQELGKNWKVIGNHGSKHAVQAQDSGLFDELLAQINEELHRCGEESSLSNRPMQRTACGSR